MGRKMPTSNKRMLFKNASARILAETHGLSPETFFPNTKLITTQDVQHVVDNTNYFLHGVALYDKKNVPTEKRYDTDWVPYTKTQFRKFYGNKDFKVHWEKGIIYKPFEDTINFTSALLIADSE